MNRMILVGLLLNATFVCSEYLHAEEPKKELIEVLMRRKYDGQEYILFQFPEIDNPFPKPHGRQEYTFLGGYTTKVSPLKYMRVTDTGYTLVYTDYFIFQENKDSPKFFCVKDFAIYKDKILIVFHCNDIPLYAVVDTKTEKVLSRGMITDGKKHPITGSDKVDYIGYAEFQEMTDTSFTVKLKVMYSSQSEDVIKTVQYSKIEPETKYTARRGWHRFER